MIVKIIARLIAKIIVETDRITEKSQSRHREMRRKQTKVEGWTKREMKSKRAKQKE